MSTRERLRFWKSLLLVQPAVAARCVAEFGREARRRGRKAPAREGPLRVAIDARKLGGRLSGVERYVAELVRGLAQAADPIRVRAYTLTPFRPAEATEGYENRSHPRSSELHRMLARDIARGEIDLVHVPWADLELTLFLPLALAPVSVLTVHDLIAWHRYCSPAQRIIYRRLLRWACGRAAAVITDSEHTRLDLERSIGVPPDRVHPVPLGVDVGFGPPADAEAIRRVRLRYGLPERFIFSLGRCFSHKNFPTLVRAVARVRAEAEVGLVIAGPKDYPPGVTEMERALREEGAAGWTRWLDHLDEADLPAVYAAAEVFAFPSLHEGFGLPLLEAMACGTPVVSSNRTSLPEVAGDAALLVDGEDVEALAGALRRLLRDQALRAQLRERGLERARAFPWERTVRGTLEVYRLALKAHAGGAG